MKILVTGARGFVGSRLMQGMQGTIASPSLRGWTQEQIDNLIEAANPDAVIHTAAISDVGACEKDPLASYQANVLLPEMLAKAAHGRKLVAFSSDQVYTGNENAGPYRETDEISPANVYGRHKREMEQRVLNANPDAVLLRATWLYDIPRKGCENRRNFLMNLLDAAKQGRAVAFSSQQYRGLTYAQEIVENAEALCHISGGIYNFGSESTLNMFDTAVETCCILNLPIETVQEGSPRHNLWMDCGKLTAWGVSFSDTLAGLKRCIAENGLA